MKRNNFDTLLDKYLADKCAADEKRLVEQWYTLLDNNDVENPKDTAAIKDKIWAKIKDHVQEQVQIQAQFTPIVPIIPFLILIITNGINNFLIK